MSNPNPEPLSAGGGIAPATTGTLNLRPEVLQGFLSVRQQHEQLQALLHQVMRRVALPRAKAIGDELLRLKSLYSPGRSGPSGHSSRFYVDAKAITGLSRATIANYIQLARGYPRLVDHMADLPEGATPVVTMKSALMVLREMNRPLRPAGDAVDVEAAAVDGVEQLAPGGRRRTRYAASTRDKVLPALGALRATTVLSDRQRDQLAQIEAALDLLLETIDRQEEQQAAATEMEEPQADLPITVAVDEAAVATTNAEPDPAPEPEWADNAGAEQDTAAKPKAGRPLAARFPKTAAGLADLRAAIAEAGSGSALARQLGISPQAVSDYLKASKGAVEAQGA